MVLSSIKADADQCDIIWLFLKGLDDKIVIMKSSTKFGKYFLNILKSIFLAIATFCAIWGKIGLLFIIPSVHSDFAFLRSIPALVQKRKFSISVETQLSTTGKCNGLRLVYASLKLLKIWYAYEDLPRYYFDLAMILSNFNFMSTFHKIYVNVVVWFRKLYTKCFEFKNGVKSSWKMFVEIFCVWNNERGRHKPEPTTEELNWTMA